MKFKKGELSSSVAVGLILLVMGAVLILIIYSTIDWTGDTNRQVCHASVVMRGALPKIANSAGIVSLNCQTQKVCITASAGLLSKFLGKEGRCEDSFSQEESVTLVKVDSLKEIEKYISRQSLKCWNMMGEGKLSLYSHFWEDLGLGIKSPDCFICNQIAFDDSILKSGISLDKLDVLDYMIGHKIPEGNLSYFQYFGGKVDPGANIEIKEYNSEDELVEFSLDDLESAKPREVNEPLAIVFSQISSPSVGSVAKTGATAAGGLLVTSGSVPFIGKSLVVKGAGLLLAKPALVVAAFALGGLAGSIGANRYITAGYCAKVTSGDSSRDGCSMIQIVPYDASALGNMCGYFEGVS
jgi:hypothetical protein